MTTKILRRDRIDVHIGRAPPGLDAWVAKSARRLQREFVEMYRASNLSREYLVEDAIEGELHTALKGVTEYLVRELTEDDGEIAQRGAA